MSAGRGAPETVQFVKFSARGWKTKNGADLAFLMVLMYVSMSLGGLVQTLRGNLFRVFVVIVGGAAFVTLMIVGVRHSLRQRRAKASAGGGEESHSRIVCVGDHCVLSAHGELADVAFEPSVFFAPTLPSAEDRFRSIVVWAGLCVLFLILAAVVSYALTGKVHGLGVVQFVGPVALAFLVAEFLFPQYVRVVPGRLDVLHFSPFGSRAVRIQKYDLKRSRVFVDLKLSVVAIDGADRTLEFSTAFIPRGRRLAYMILLAAISTHEPGPLPDDELLG